MRRSGRIQKGIAVLLLGSDTSGQEFSEQTKTTVLSRHGAAIVSKRKLAPEQQMILRCLENNREGEARVVGQIGEVSDGYVYGVAFLDDEVRLWDEEFPPLTTSEKQASRAFLKCSSCQATEAVYLTDLEMDVLTINGGLLRGCKHCRLSTIWRRTDGPVDTKPTPTSVEQEPGSESTIAPAASPRNRRKDVRAKVNFSARIRDSTFEEIVVCENASRGGLCFRSRRRYLEKSTIEVAAPYSPGMPSLFVPAQIVYVRELPEGKLFRYGVAYIQSAKNREI
jgi:hypothetical protein